MCNQANDSTSFDYFVKVLNVLASKILWSLCVVFWPTFWPTFGWIIEQNMYAKENLFEKCVFKGTVHIEILKNILWLFSHFHAVRNLFDFFWNKWRCFKECSVALFWIVTSSSKSDRKKCHDTPNWLKAYDRFYLAYEMLDRKISHFEIKLFIETLEKTLKKINYRCVFCWLLWSM